MMLNSTKGRCFIIAYRNLLASALGSVYLPLNFYFMTYIPNINSFLWSRDFNWTDGVSILFGKCSEQFINIADVRFQLNNLKYWLMDWLEMRKNFDKLITYYIKTLTKIEKIDNFE